ncbi:uncharacterized protein LOC116138745 [Pistacia vera]|uniref:uncharacterized protein LOC116138745 n=1 Tax=Pistacia vera TaxID=55513 RepID=UPI001262C361|nr:uncharacterized protein LOC116138745 [Pistacia vera]
MGTEFVNNSPILESEEGYTIGKLNQGQRVELDGRAEKKVHQFYFIKIWPYGDQNVKSRIEEAEKLIEKIDEDAFHINTKYRKLMSDRTYKVLCLLGRLYKRIVHIDCTVNWNTQQLDRLKQLLEQLTSRKIAYNGTDMNSWSSRELIKSMRHKNNNLPTERQLLRQISSESQKRGAVDSFLSAAEDFSAHALLSIRISMEKVQLGAAKGGVTLKEKNATLK